MTTHEKTELRISRLENDREDLYEISTRIEDKVDTLDTEFREFKTRMLGFEAEMVSFKTEMLDFKAEMVSFKAEMLDFKAEMVSFKTEMLDFKTEILRRLPAPPDA